MAEAKPNSSIDPKSGFNSNTKIYQNLRPPVTLPPQTLPLSAAEYAFDILNKTLPSPQSVTALIDTATGTSLSFSDFIQRTQSLTVTLRAQFGLQKGDSAFILSPSSLQIPVLYLSLLSLGVVISPANPVSTKSEISRQISLTKPVIAFATASTAAKIPSLRQGTVLLDSDEFESMTNNTFSGERTKLSYKIKQSDTAAILYSSGTTGRVKGVELTHRNFIALLAGFDQVRYEYDEKPPQRVVLFTVPLFHVYGLVMCLRSFMTGETIVFMERFDFEEMLKTVERYRVTFMPVSPPLVVAMAKSPLVDKYDLSSLVLIGCGGAPLGKEVSEKFKERFPNVEVTQGYGMTETTGGATRMIGPEETKKHGTVGKLAETMEAKIVDPVTGEALPPGQRGELWLRGPFIMRGYVGDDEATASTMDSEGWLKTGDLCYIDSEGFLFIVDRLKELIKYKAYQVPPAELEHLLQSHPEISDVAVIPYPDEEAGQVPMAFVVRKPGSNLDGAQVMDFVSKQVAPYKKVRRVAFINAIPKSPAGKILRRELIELATSSPSAKL